MRQSGTVLHHLNKLLDYKNPYSTLHMDVKIGYGSDKPILLSSEHHSVDDMVSVLFDKSIEGYFIHDVWSSTRDFEYTITLDLKLDDKKNKTNIDESVIQEIAKILEEAE